MTDTPRIIVQPGTQPGAWALVLVSVAVALLAFGALQGAAWAIAGGVFEYPLDDVYIHLAMAEGIAAGGYGLNPGEYASASSSILYPVLLAPFAGSETQRLLPLAWNTLSISLVAALWGLALARSGLTARARWGLALAVPLGFNVAGVGYTGMENSLHTAAAMATVIGLWRFLRTGQIGVLLVAGTILAPMFRLEGLALSGLACAVVALRGQRRAGLILGAAMLAPVLGFMALLTGLGLDPLPASVLAKTAMAVQAEGLLDRLILRVLLNLHKPAGGVLAALTLILLLAPLMGAGLRRDGRGILAVVLGLAGLAHLIAGQIGWMHRYEHYILMAQITGLMLISAGAGTPLAQRRWAVLAAVAAAAAAVVFWPGLALNYLWNPSAIHLQQGQMARFARDYVKAPVAVNDLGWVAWQNPQYVLDLYGLGSHQALVARLGGQDPAWVARLTRTHGADLAMIYDAWFGAQIGADWVRLGTLTMRQTRGALGEMQVAFYATRPEAAAALGQKLHDFAATLPEGAGMAFPATSAAGAP